MAESLNQQIADQLVERQLRVGRVETTLRRQVWEQLALLEAEILRGLKSADPTAFVLLSRRRREVEQLMEEELDPLIVSRYLRLATMMDRAMGHIAVGETQAVQRIINGVTADETIADTPDEAALTRRVAGTLFPTPATPTDLSTTGAEWWQRQGDALSQRMRDTLRVSVSLEESLTQLTQRVRGTSEQGLQDGVMAKARQDAARLLTTHMTHALNEGRVATGERHADQGLIAIHQSTIDARTSALCVARHGLHYALPDYTPMGHSIPYLGGPPYHPNCRSLMTIGLRGHGTILQDNLETWLQRRDRAFQDAVLGPTRAHLWRAGRLTLRQLIDATSGRPLTLEELDA